MMEVYESTSPPVAMTDRQTPPRIRISVALCSYNGESYIGEQLQSLAGQTRVPDELIVVDDGSGDATEGVVRDFARGVAFPVQWHRNAERLGVAQNFERAIGLTSGDIVFLSDQDDVWLPAKIERTLARFDAPEVLVVHTDARLVDGELRDLGSGLLEALEFSLRERELFAQGRSYEVLLRRSLVTGATAAIRRALFDAAQPFGKGWVHDEWLALLGALLGQVRCVDEPLVLYRQHGRNQIGARKRSWSERYLPRSKLGREFHRLRADKLELVCEHLNAKALPVLSERRLELEDAIRHARFRSEVPDSLPARLWPIVRELTSGRYHRYSNGWRGALRDVIEPALPEEPKR